MTMMVEKAKEDTKNIDTRTYLLKIENIKPAAVSRASISIKEYCQKIRKIYSENILNRDDEVCVFKLFLRDKSLLSKILVRNH